MVFRWIWQLGKDVQFCMACNDYFPKLEPFSKTSLQCQFCEFITAAVKPSKAKKQIEAAQDKVVADRCTESDIAADETLTGLWP